MSYVCHPILIKKFKDAIFDCFVDSDDKVKSLLETNDVRAALQFLIAAEEPINPKIDGRSWNHCGACDCILFRSYVFCPNCGRKIAWIE